MLCASYAGALSLFDPDHDLVELFAKRNFRCDCGTLSIQRGGAGGQNKQKTSPCKLRPSPLSFAPENDDNVYTANFKGRFCYCKRGETYNPETEEEVRDIWRKSASP